MTLDRQNTCSPSPRLALASPLGLCAVGVIQLVGNNAIDLVNRFLSEPMPDETGKIFLRTFRDEHARPIDQILAVQRPGPMVEITCHGGVRIVQRIIDTLEHAGATLVEGESLIAESFGLSDPVESEAYRLLPRAKTTLAVKFLLAQAHGTLGELVKTGGNKEAREAVMTYWPAVRFLLDGVRIVIAGPPNVGKSTLLNALTQSSRALVADLPGTTRDYVQFETEFSGLPATLIDTAGLGPTADPLADEVRRRSLEQITQADLVLILLDATDPRSNEQFLEELPQNLSRAIILINKIDLLSPNQTKSVKALLLPCGQESLFKHYPKITISALKRHNLEALSEMIWRQVGLEGLDYRRPTVFSEPLAHRIKAFDASSNTK